MARLSQRLGLFSLREPFAVQYRPTDKGCHYGFGPKLYQELCHVYRNFIASFCPMAEASNCDSRACCPRRPRTQRYRVESHHDSAGSPQGSRPLDREVCKSGVAAAQHGTCCSPGFGTICLVRLEKAASRKESP